MKSLHLLIGTLIVFSLPTITASGQLSHTPEIGSGGNQNATSIRSSSVDLAVSDGAVSENLLDPGPNLTADGQPKSFSFDPATSMLTINARVKNIGTTTAGMCYLGYYLSTNTSIAPTDLYIGYDVVESLAPDGTSDETFTTDVSAYPGTWYVGFLIDYMNIVAEDKETDNTHCFTPEIIIFPLAAPDAPVLIYPLDGATGIPIDPILRWTWGSGGYPDLYWVEVYDELGTCVYSNSTTIRQQQVGPLVTDALYSWKVYAENSYGSSPYSAVWSFTTSATPVLSESYAEIPHAFALKPPYPNPFNPVTTIGFDLPKPGIVRLIIYDPLGREIETLIDGAMVAGAHEMTWHAEGLTSGIYLCRLEADGFVDTRKLILQR
jgi:hypothetical protein